ncbi:hypothetical protein [Streptomyces sanglieri]|uniref:hypothetical protein n=1 Tax=Streptomyces sanglieri TaxID=193460 RepID=UPI003523C8C0
MAVWEPPVLTVGYPVERDPRAGLHRLEPRLVGPQLLTPGQHSGIGMDMRGMTF